MLSLSAIRKSKTTSDTIEVTSYQHRTAMDAPDRSDRGGDHLGEDHRQRHADGSDEEPAADNHRTPKEESKAAIPLQDYKHRDRARRLYGDTIDTKDADGIRPYPPCTPEL